MFSKFKGMMKLSEASNVVKDALRKVSIGSPDFDIDTLATRHYGDSITVTHYGDSITVTALR